MSDESPKAPPGSPDYLLKIAALVESQLQFEAGWTGQRMMWLVVSQSFLFSAFATTVKGGKPPFSMGNPESWLPWVLPLLGVSHSIAAYISIQSAQSVDRAIAQLRGKLGEQLQLLPGLETLPLLGPTNRTGAIRHTYRSGGWASQIIPITLTLAWAALLMSVVIGSQ